MTDKPGDASPRPRLGLFEGFGVEIEYMIVDAVTLDVAPIADRLMEAVAGEPRAEVELGEIAWSNELVLHVLEMKTNGPAPTLTGLSAHFVDALRRADEALRAFGCRLLPGGMHPWMNPATETRLWPHEYGEVYRTFDRIFSCRGHGWANLQSTHLNLPFQGDHEFAALHAAIRGILPLVPALAASSPVLDGRVAQVVDQRLIEYGRNSQAVPSVAGALIPDPIGSEEEYRGRILEPMYQALAPLDPEGILRHEWVNARGVIARFDRGTLEVRLLDPQEAPRADLAVVSAISRVAFDLCARFMTGDARLNEIPTRALAEILHAVTREGDRAVIRSVDYLAGLDVPEPHRARKAGALWRDLLERAEFPPWAGAPPLFEGGEPEPLEVILEHGPLARRILERTGAHPSRARLEEEYRALADCLRADRTLGPF